MTVPLWLESAVKAGVGLVSLNTIRSLGPFILYQSERGRNALKQFHEGQANNEAPKGLIKAEADNRASIHKRLLEQCVDAKPEDLVGIQQKAEFVEATIRQLHVAAKSLDYSKSEATPPKPDESKQFIADSWIDRFNEIARKRNEEWRAELLARALAAETAKPGCVSARALWFIGTVEEESFRAFQQLLDLCIFIHPDGIPFIPSTEPDVYTLKSENQEHSVGQLAYKLGDLGILANSLSAKDVSAGGRLIFYHGDKAIVVMINNAFRIKGVLFTPLGESLAKFCDSSPDPFGYSRLAEFAKYASLNSNLVMALKRSADGKIG